MAKMKIAPHDRVTVRSECMRMLRTLKLDPARSKLIAGFVETYLTLSTAEMRHYERQFEKLTPAEQEETVGLISSWEQQGIDKGIEKGIETGIEKGIHEGKESIVVRLLKRQVGEVSSALLARVDHLSNEQLDDLGEALLDFTSTADLEGWLAER